MNLKKITAMGLLVAMQIILSRFFSISLWNMKIGFGFLPVAVAAILFGPVAGGIVGAVSDFLGAVLFPIGQYFPGFTLTASLSGVVYGVFLHKKQTVGRICAAVAITQPVLGLLLNTLWISVLYGTPYVAVFGTRLVQFAILIPTELILLYFVSKSICFCKEKVYA